jgi:formyltetrahydrofolate-dependent phosphoribosylglycinamide formyltransferase
MNIAVFVSGRGSNFRAIQKSIKANEISASIKAVVSDKEKCPAFEFAKQEKIPIFSVSINPKSGFLSWEEILENLQNMEIELVVLAGFLKKIPDFVVDYFYYKMINIHPALLPSFGGKGMYGMNVHNAVFEKSAQVSGATVHFVNKIYDDGKIIAQRSVNISDVKTPEEIAERVLNIEHKLLPYVVKKFVENKIILKNSRVYLLD